MIYSIYNMKFSLKTIYYTSKNVLIIFYVNIFKYKNLYNVKHSFLHVWNNIYIYLFKVAYL